MAKQSYDDFITAFSARQKDWQAFAERLNHLLADLLSAGGVDYHVIEARAKSLESLREKLQRSGKSYSEPAKDIPDLAGVRIVLYDQKGVGETLSLIDREFDVDTRASTDKANELSPDQFGYLSVHKIVALPKARASMTEWSRFANMHAEIQIRTVLQHAWASISHKLQYKRESEIPSKLRRRLTRLAGLFELADDEFLALRFADAEVRKTIAEEVATRAVEVSLDLVSLRDWAKGSPLIKILRETVGAGACEIVEKEPETGYSQLLRVLIILNISTLGELEDALKRVLAKAPQFFSTLKSSMSGTLPHFAAVLFIAANQAVFSTPDKYPFPDKPYIGQIARAAKIVFT